MSSPNRIKSSSRTVFGEKKTFASWSKNYKRGKINSTDNLSCDFDSTSPNSPKKTTPTNKKISYSGKNMKNSNFSPNRREVLTIICYLCTQNTNSLRQLHG